MNDIDKIIRQAVEGHEVPFDPSAWDKLSNQLSPLEDGVRNAVEGHEVPYNPAAWSAIKGQIGGSNIMKWIAGAAGAAAITIAGVYLLSDNVEEQSSQPIVEVNDTNTTSNQMNSNAETNTTSTLDLENTPNDLNDATLITENTGDNASTTTTSNETPNGVNDVASNENTIDHSATSTDTQTTSNSEGNNTSTSSSDDPNGSETTTDNGTAQNTSGDEPDGNANNNPENATDQWANINANYSASDWTACVGTEISFNPKMAIEQLTYEWNFGDGRSESVSHPSHIFTESGDYEVTLNITDKDGKTIASSKEQITIFPSPSADFSWSSLEERGIPTYYFEHENDQANQTQWFVDGRMYSDQSQFEHTFRAKGDHSVVLHTQNAMGCKNESTQAVNVENNYNLNAPNAISLSSPSANSFMPTALINTENEFLMTIYDKNGAQVFHTNSANEPWTGMNENDNSIVPTGAYVWVVKLKNGNGLYETYTDNVIVVP